MSTNKKSQRRLGYSTSEFKLACQATKNSDSNCCEHTINDLNERVSNLARSLSRSSSDDLSALNNATRSETSGGNKTKSDCNVNKKPLLVELHSFPGYHDNELTPLPCGLTARMVLAIVTNAQVDLRRKPTFRKTFEEFFLSQQSIAVQQDMFWWTFCDKYQPHPEFQEMLFQRIAKHYTELVVIWTASRYHDKLFQSYANLMAQAVYCTFCHSFPDSYHQFTIDFCEELLAINSLWMFGTRPAPHHCCKWNFVKLEPSNMRKRGLVSDDVQKDSSDSPSVIKFHKLFDRSKGPQNVSDESKDPLQTNDDVRSHVESDDTSNKIPDDISKDPAYSKVVYDIYGRSPLVAHFLQRHELLAESRISVLVQRTEMETSMDSSRKISYSELARRKLKALEKNKKIFDERSRKHLRQCCQVTRERQKMVEHFDRCASNLLSNPHDVKQISELLRQPDIKEELEETDVRLSKLRNILTRALDDTRSNFFSR